jgi:hypothetical protein
VKGIIVIFFLAILPSLLYFWIVPRAKQRFQARMRRIRSRTVYHQPLEREDFDSYSQSFNPYSEFIGDITCRFNAHSPYLRCAVNPDGPCEGCSLYESR